MDIRLWAVLCCALMVIAVAFELLTPTMGGWTLAALGCAALSVFLGFRQSTAFGYSMLAANLALFPLALWASIYFIKRSPMIHRDEIAAGNQDAPDAPPLTHLLGESGLAITPLRPAGAAMICEQRMDVVTEGKFVDVNTPIKVIHVEGSRIVVEPV